MAYDRRYNTSSKAGLMRNNLENTLPNSAQNIDQVLHGQSVETLRRIAATLSLPESAFYDVSEAGSALDAISELLRIWDSLEHAADRQKLLVYARTLSLRN